MTRHIAIAGTLSLLLWGLLSWMTHGIDGAPGDLASGFHFEVDNDDTPTLAYLALHALLCGVLTVLLVVLARKETGSGLRLAIGFAVAFRLVMIPSVPIHESDFYRYFWDGKVAAQGINPFRFRPWDVRMFEAEASMLIEDPSVAPQFQEGRGFSEDDIPALQKLVELWRENPDGFERVSHPEVRTIYPPLAQAVFFLSTFLFGHSILGLKLMIFAFDLGVIAVVLALLRQLNRHPLWVLAYAWNPLVVKEFANSAHYDAVPVFFTVLAVWLAVASKSKWKTALALAAGSLAKLFSVILLPILLPPRLNNLRPWLVFSAAVMFGFLPFLLWDGVGFEHLFGGLKAYSERWHFNGGVFMPSWLLFLFAFPPEADFGPIAAKIVCGVALISVLLFLILRTPEKDSGESVTHRAFILVAALFVLSPTAFPWYFTWVLPFVCLFPSAAWIGLSFLLPMTYLDFHSAEDFSFVHQYLLYLPVTWWLIWLPFAAFVILDRWRVHFFRPTTTR